MRERDSGHTDMFLLSTTWLLTSKACPRRPGCLGARSSRVTNPAECTSDESLDSYTMERMAATSAHASSTRTGRYNASSRTSRIASPTTGESYTRRERFSSRVSESFQQ
jgi:hypothetical protein